MGWILWVPSNIHNSKRQIKHVCHRLGNVYLEGDAFWSKKWTSNILESYHKNIQKNLYNFMKIFLDGFIDVIPRHGNSFAKSQIMFLEI